MSVVISIYSKHAYKEYMLPAINNTEYTLVVDRHLFHLKESLLLKMEVLDGVWSFLSGNYTVIKDGENQSGKTIGNQASYCITLNTNEKLYANSSIQNSVFSTYKKYRMDGLEKLEIGSNPGLPIRYSFTAGKSEFISGNHAELYRKGSDWELRDLSRNGSFLNHKRITGTAALSYGDHINIWGLDMIYLKDFFAIRENPDLFVDLAVLKPYSAAFSEDETAETPCRQQTFFHRFPRNLESLETEPVEIEGPPAPKEKSDTPLLMQIGPALTMTLPMLLGSGMAVLSSRMGGTASAGFMYTGLVTAGCSGAIGAFWAFNNIRYAEQKRKKDEAHRFDAYSRYLLDHASEIQEKYEYNQKNLLKRYPSAEQLVGDGTSMPDGLWGRNTGHPDFLYERLGIGDMPFQVPVQIPKERFALNEDELAKKPKMIQEKYAVLRGVPIGVDLLQHRLIGVIGGKDQKGAYPVIRNLVAQIATQNCYTDVKMAFLCKQQDAEADHQWDFILWLPHVWNETRKFRFAAFGEQEVSDVCFELTKIIRERVQNASGQNETEPLVTPHYIVFVEKSSLLEDQLIEKYLFDPKAVSGITTVLMAERYEDLPNTCETVIENDDLFMGMYSTKESLKQRISLDFDKLSETALNNLARSMSPVRVNERELGGEIPSSVSFLEMYGVKRLEELQIEERWKRNRNYESLKALIGIKTGGQPCFLDLHEKYHGPHGLVAGTTGSGKSETLQTYILSLAINFSPDDVGFFIIDYKGGGMGNLFAGLPHVLGQISNLSGNQIRRAMVSIKSENLRRQRIFNENEVNNINAYTVLYKNGEAKVPVPHLFIIIDEFAELKREEPDFMRELISVAQVGRSLGVHLILATQKPAGTVDDNIWSNAKFRLCLRVQDRQDSMDMLHKPDAAYLTTTGRGYLQVGNDELYEQFQSGWSGAVFEKDGGKYARAIAQMITSTGKTAIVGNHTKAMLRAEERVQWIKRFLHLLQQIPEQPEEEEIQQWRGKLQEAGFGYVDSEYNAKLLRNLKMLYQRAQSQSNAGDIAQVSKWIIERADLEKIRIPEMKQQTQLEAVVGFLAGKAVENHIQKQQPLWLPPLSEQLYLPEMKTWSRAWNEEKTAFTLSAEVGIYDDPANQIQLPVRIDFFENGNLAVCGIPLSGKSTYIQTLLYALISRYDPSRLNLYLLDFSSRALEVFEEAPHTGGILYENDLDTIGKFFNILDRMLQERKRVFKGGNYQQYIRKHGCEFPAVIVAIDNYTAFSEKTEGKYEELILRLSRESAANGIYLLLSAASYGMNGIPNRLHDNIRKTVCLELQDKFQYMDFLGTMHIDMLPEAGISGRGLVQIEDTALEFQTYLALEAQDDYERGEKIKADCRHMKQRWTGKRAMEIPHIPEKPVWSEFSKLGAVKAQMEKRELLPIGYSEKTADIYSVYLPETYCYLISGKVKTGKTNLLRIMMRGAAMKQAEVLVMEFGDSELQEEAAQAGAEYVRDCEGVFRWLQTKLPEIQKRNQEKKQMRMQNKDEIDIFRHMSDQKPWFIFISDLTEFSAKLHGATGALATLPATLTNILEKGELLNLYFFACVNPDKTAEVLGQSIYKAFADYGVGIHLGGNGDSQRLLNLLSVPMRELGRTEKAGTGYAVNAEGKIDKVIIPLARG